jgi:hypothetical protein
MGWNSYGRLNSPHFPCAVENERPNKSLGFDVQAKQDRHKGGQNRVVIRMMTSRRVHKSGKMDNRIKNVHIPENS